MRRFIREVQAAALLSHPNIVTVFHTDLECARPYLAMEYVAGIDLMKLVKRVGPAAGGRVAAITSSRRPRACSTPSSAAWCIATSSRPT